LVKCPPEIITTAWTPASFACSRTCSRAPKKLAALSGGADSRSADIIGACDARYESFRFTLPDVVADNASAGGFLLGRAAVHPADLVDLPLVGCVLRVDGEVVATAAGAATTA
jgi:hypothetical protein